MPRSHLARLFSILFFVVALAPPAAWGTPCSNVGIFARTWDFLASIWSAEGGCSTAEGCKLDSHGSCAAAEEAVPIPPPTTDEGCIIDPHGGCRPGS